MGEAVYSRAEVLHRVQQPRFIFSHVANVLRETLAWVSPLEFDATFRRVRSMTMVSHRRLRSLQEAVRYVVAKNIPGDIVECGVARGGSAAVMALTLQQLGARRRLWLFDTFSGLPQPNSADPDYEIARNYAGHYGTSIDTIRASFERLGISTTEIEFVPGLFQHTLSGSNVSQIALLHVDGDWYESVRTTLESFYDRVSSGAVIQFDDYGYWLGAQKAVDEFINKRGIKAELNYIDFAGRRMIKPAQS